MNRKLHLALLCLLLCAAGLGAAGYKAFVLDFPVMPDSTSSLWTVEASVSFAADEKPAKVSLFVPKSNQEIAIVDESFISSGFGLTTKQTKLNRRVTWSIRRSSGPHKLFYRALMRQLESEASPEAAPPPPEKKPFYEGAALAAAQSVIALLHAESADNETFINNLLRRIEEPRPEENLRLLIGKKPDRFRRIVTAARLLNTAGLRARAVHGVQLRPQLKDAPLEHWLEVYDPNSSSWSTFGRDPEAAEETPYLAWWRGDQPLAEIDGGEHLQAKISITRSEEEAIDSAMARAGLASRFFLDYSLLSLPLTAQAVYRIILLVPVGALIVVVLRNVIGFRTIGTFMPVLIALAFRETELLTGIVFFSAIVATGLAVRFYLEHLKLLLVPRLAAIVVIVVLLMAALSVITHRLGIEHGLSVSLFPMIIMTMTIERMSIIWEEAGPFASVSEAFSSLLVAVLAYLVITNPLVEHVVLVFPELLLVVLAIVLLLGRYTGYRLLELFRFRGLIEG